MGRAHYLLVDGYNVIHADREMSGIAAYSLEAARVRLCDTLCEFKALTSYQIIVVFDAHLVEGGVGSTADYHNIKIVFTKEAETADHYIEKSAYTLSRGTKKDRITVATSDLLEQIIIMGSGARRVSAGDLLTEIEQARASMRARYLNNKPVKKNPISSLLDPETARKLDEMRYGKKNT